LSLKWPLIAGLLVQRARRRRAERALRESEERYRNVVDAHGLDITERRRAEEGLRDHQTALSASYRRIHDLAGRLIAGQEAERHRSARELHDDLSQKLALLMVDIEQLARGALPGAAGLAERVGEISQRAAEIATDVHRLSHELHPARLEALGLVASIHSICRDVGRQHGIAVDFSHHSVPTAIPPQVALCFYRVVQEALHNVVKHSGARRAAVELTSGDGRLDLAIADSGVGFVPSDVRSTGLGLVSMRERVNFLGGIIAIHSAPGLGTRIGVRVSMERRGRPPGPQTNPQTAQPNVQLAVLARSLGCE
jgi:signal transduction histidine kinase